METSGPILREPDMILVIIEGKAEEATYLVITDEGIEFRPAGHLSEKQWVRKPGLFERNWMIQSFR